MLMSTAATTFKPPGAESKMLETYNIFTKNVIKFGAYLVFDRKWSPISFVPFLSTSYLVEKFCRDDLLNLPKKEQELIINFYLAINKYGNQYYSLVGHFFDWVHHSKLPSGIYFNEIMSKYNFVLFYGDNDWNKTEPVQELIEQLPENHKCEGIHLIKDCEHCLMIQNPNGINEQIFKFYEIFKNKDEENL